MSSVFHLQFTTMTVKVEILLRLLISSDPLVDVKHVTASLLSSCRDT